MDCGSLVSITWSGIGIGVAGCYWWGDGTCCAIGWGWVWLGGWGQEVGHVLHGTNPFIINHKFTKPSSISTLGDFSLSQNGQLILAQPNFHTLNRSGQCSPKHKLFSFFFWCHMIDETVSHPYIMKISRETLGIHEMQKYYINIMQTNQSLQSRESQLLQQ